MKKGLLALFAVVISCCSTAQSINTTDSSTVNITSYSTAANAQFLQITDSTKRADSLQINSLQTEISQLKASDNERKIELRQRLDSLKRKNAERAILMQHRVDSLRAVTVGSPVEFGKDTLFYVFTKLGPYSAHQRATHTRNNILKLAEAEDFDPEFLKIDESDATYDLFYHNLIILSITDADAFWQNKSREQLAIQYRELIVEKIQKYRHEHGFFSTLIRIGLLLLVVLILVIGIKLMNRGITRLNNYLMLKSSKHIGGLKVGNYQVIEPVRMRMTIRFAMRVFKWFLILLVVYISLPTIFSIFPATESLATTLFGYVLNPLKSIVMGIFGYIPELMTIIVILVVVHYFIRFLKSFAVEASAGVIELPGFYPEWALPTFNLLRVVIYTFAFIVIFPYLPGSDSPVFRGVGVFFGILISLGSTSAVGNIVAGLVITYMRPFKIGDRVKIGEITGDVIEKNLLVTRLKTIKNEDVSIPNAAILTGSTINYSANSGDIGLILHTTVTIGYDVPWRKIHQLLIDAALQTKLVLKDPSPFVLQTSLDDFYVSYQINLYTREPNQSTNIYSELHSNIQDKFSDAGVEIMSPHYRAERDGNEVTLPKPFPEKESKTDDPGTFNENPGDK